MSLVQVYCWAVYTFVFLCIYLLIRIRTIRSRVVQNGVLATCGLLLSLTICEILLSSGVLDWNHVWIPLRYQALDYRLNVMHLVYSRRNPYGFNDSARQVEKPASKARIAILGDSFVWGDGLPRSQVWSLKLARRIEEAHPSIEVMNWGRNGWSTKDELQFLEKHGHEYSPDMLVVGFVPNDPDLGRYLQVYPNWHKSPAWTPFGVLFPETFNFLHFFVNTLISNYSSDLGYANWESKLYGEENLELYGRLLQEFARYTSERRIELLFVLTPPSPNEIYRHRFDEIVPLLERAGIEYLDLFPRVSEELGSENPNDLKANRANAHPGPKMTELFARETFEYLRRRGILETLASKAQAKTN